MCLHMNGSLIFHSTNIGFPFPSSVPNKLLHSFPTTPYLCFFLFPFSLLYLTSTALQMIKSACRCQPQKVDSIFGVVLKRRSWSRSFLLFTYLSSIFMLDPLFSWLASIALCGTSFQDRWEVRTFHGHCVRFCCFLCLNTVRITADSSTDVRIFCYYSTGQIRCGYY